MKKIAIICFLLALFVISAGFGQAEDNVTPYTGFIFGSLDVSEAQQTLLSISFIRYPSPAIIGDLGLPHDIRIKLVPEKGLFYAVDVAPNQYYLHALEMRKGKYSSEKTFAYYCMKPKDQDLITVNGGQIVYFGSYRFKTLKKDRLFAPGSFTLEKQNTPNEKELLEKLLTVKEIQGSKWESQIKECLTASTDVNPTNNNATQSTGNLASNNATQPTDNLANNNATQPIDNLANNKVTQPTDNLANNNATQPTNNLTNRNAAHSTGFLFGALDISETKQTLLSISFLKYPSSEHNIGFGLPHDFYVKLVPEKGLFYAADVVPNQYYLFAFDMRKGKYSSEKTYAYVSMNPKEQDIFTIDRGQIIYYGSYRFKTLRKDRLFNPGSFTLEKQGAPSEKELLEKLLTLKEIQGSKWELQLKERLASL